MVPRVDITHEQLEEMLQRAAEAGAKLALERVGLHDEDAGHDVQDLRELLRSWRSARKSIWDAAIRSLTTMILAFLVASVAVSVKVSIKP